MAGLESSDEEEQHIHPQQSALKNPFAAGITGQPVEEKKTKQTSSAKAASMGRTAEAHATVSMGAGSKSRKAVSPVSSRGTASNNVSSQGRKGQPVGSMRDENHRGDLYKSNPFLPKATRTAHAAAGALHPKPSEGLRFSTGPKTDTAEGLGGSTRLSGSESREDLPGAAAKAESWPFQGPEPSLPSKSGRTSQLSVSQAYRLSEKGRDSSI